MNIVMINLDAGENSQRLDLIKRGRYVNFLIADYFFDQRMNPVFRDGLRHLQEATRRLDLEVIGKDLSKIQFPQYNNITSSNLVFNAMHYHLINSGVFAFPIVDHTKSWFSNHKVNLALLDLDNPKCDATYKGLAIKANRDKMISEVFGGN